ncbi:hypothetical protein MMC11_002968 [Xylographa trunciseda]|nr:hypothetical protein [Xylographa trunciseda]
MTFVAEIADVRDLDMDQDLFEARIDSLQVLRMARELRIQLKRAGLGKANEDIIPPTKICLNSTLNQLVAFVLREVNVDLPIKSHIQGSLNNQPRGQINHHANGICYGHVNGHERNSTTENMEALLRAYFNSLPLSSHQSPLPSTQNMTVILTGSTGSLGSYLLEALYHDQNVSHIICQTAPKRSRSSLNPHRVEFLIADLSKPLLGLEPMIYDRMLGNVTHIIHNQWPVNFNWALSSFEPHICGVHDLVRFSLASTHKSFLLFVSSVAAVGAWKGHG